MSYISSKCVCHYLHQVGFLANQRDNITFLCRKAGAEPLSIAQANLHRKIRDDSDHSSFPLSLPSRLLLHLSLSPHFRRVFLSIWRIIIFHLQYYKGTWRGWGEGYCQYDSFFSGHSVPGFCQLHQHPSSYRDRPLIMLCM